MIVEQNSLMSGLETRSLYFLLYLKRSVVLQYITHFGGWWAFFAITDVIITGLMAALLDDVHLLSMSGR